MSWTLGPVWLRVVSGTEGGAAGQKSCACVGCVCLSVCTAEVPCTCCTLIFGLSHTSTAAAGPLLCATKACPPSGALCVPLCVGFYFNLYFSCKPKLEVCETADLMLRDNFGQFSVGSETLGEVWEVPHKK